MGLEAETKAARVTFEISARNRGIRFACFPVFWPGCRYIQAAKAWVRESLSFPTVSLSRATC